MVFVDDDVRFRLEQSLCELVCGHETVEAAEGDGILYPRIMGIEGDDVADTHVRKFFQGISAVEGFPAASLMLPALIQKGHDNSDAVGFSACRRDNPFQILIVVIRGFAVYVTVHLIGDAVVADIQQDIEILAADGFPEDSLALAGAETGAVHVGKKIIFMISLKSGIVCQIFMGFLSKGCKIIIDNFAHLCGRVKSYDF